MNVDFQDIICKCSAGYLPQTCLLADRDAEARRMDLNQITEKVIGVAIEINKTLAPGLLESAYEECLYYELSRAGLRFQRQVDLPVVVFSASLRLCGERLHLILSAS